MAPAHQQLDAGDDDPTLSDNDAAENDLADLPAPTDGRALLEVAA